MFPILAHLRIVEAASFIAAPSCALHLLQLGAEVIRIDDLRGSLDRRRWPVSPAGASLYWEGLNKGKKSVTLDLTSPAGRELATAIITAPGKDRGLFVTNYPAGGFLSHDRLTGYRPDLVTLRLMGRSDGQSAVDYTVNSALGVPMMTGHDLPGHGPVNHVLPAWDLIAGAYAAFALLAAENHRQRTGLGQEVRVPLADIAATALGNIGQVAEVVVSGEDRPRIGNQVFGAFGRDFATADGTRLMLVAISPRQWSSLVEALEIGPEIAALEQELGLSFARDEGLRYIHRARVNSVVEAACLRRPQTELAERCERLGVCWGPYRTLREAVAVGDLARTPGLFEDVRHAGGEIYTTPGAPAGFSAFDRAAPAAAPRFGEHTEEVLSQLLGLSSVEVAALVDRGIIAAAA